MNCRCSYSFQSIYNFFFLKMLSSVTPDKAVGTHAHVTGRNLEQDQAQTQQSEQDTAEKRRRQGGEDGTRRHHLWIKMWNCFYAGDPEMNNQQCDYYLEFSEPRCRITVSTFTVGLFLPGVGEAFKFEWLLKWKKFGQSEVKAAGSHVNGWCGARTAGQCPLGSPWPLERWKRSESFPPPRR